jgi:hypothetical protein
MIKATNEEAGTAQKVLAHHNHAGEWAAAAIWI